MITHVHACTCMWNPLKCTWFFTHNFPYYLIIPLSLFATWEILGITLFKFFLNFLWHPKVIPPLTIGGNNLSEGSRTRLWNIQVRIEARQATPILCHTCSFTLSTRAPCTSCHWQDAIGSKRSRFSRGRNNRHTRSILIYGKGLAWKR